MDKVLAIIEFKGKILIGKIKAEKIKDFGGIKYVFPGGSVKENESLEKAAVREAKEETGLEIKIIKLIGERTHPVTKKKIYYYHCSSDTDKTTTKSLDNDDLESLIWASQNELLKYMPTLFLSIKEYFKEQRLAIFKRLAGSLKNSKNWKNIDASAWQRKLRREKGI